MTAVVPKPGPLLGSLGLHAAALTLAAFTGLSVTRAPELAAGPRGGGDGSIAIQLVDGRAAGDPTLVDDVLPGVIRPELLEPSFPVLRDEAVETPEPTAWLADSSSAAVEPEVVETSTVVELERSATLALAGMRAGPRNSRAHRDEGSPGTPVPGVPVGGEGWGGALAAIGAMGAGGGGIGTGIGSGSGPGVGSGGGVEGSGPALLEGQPPAYPKSSVRAEEEGSVLCRIHVSAEGLVTAVDVMVSSGHDRLDRAATEAIRKWRFEPKRVDGRSIATAIVHRVTFRLDRV